MNESRPPSDDEQAPGSDRPDDAAAATGDTDAHRPAEAAEDEGGPADSEAAPAQGSPPAGDGDGTGKGPPGTATPGPAPTKGRRGTGWRAVAIVALIGALAAGGFAGYLFQRVERLASRIDEIPAARSVAIDSLADDLDVRDEVAALEGSLRDETQAREALASRLDDELDPEIERLATAVEDIREQATGHHTRWRLAEVRFLLRIGAQRLRLAGDVDGAAAAFEAADEALHRFGDPRLLPLRGALVEDLARIRAVEPADIEGIALRLYNLERRVARLPLATAAATTRDEAIEPDSGAPLWRRMLDRLQGLVTIRHREVRPEQAARADAESLPPREALVLALREARRAALANDAERYRSALASADEVVAAHFDGETSPVARFAEALESVAERRVRTPMPDLSATLDRAAELTARIEAERARATPAAEANAGDDETTDEPAGEAGGGARNGAEE